MGQGEVTINPCDYGLSTASTWADNLAAMDAAYTEATTVQGSPFLRRPNLTLSTIP